MITQSSVTADKRDIRPLNIDTARSMQSWWKNVKKKNIIIIQYIHNIQSEKTAELSVFRTCSVCKEEHQQQSLHRHCGRECENELIFVWLDIFHHIHMHSICAAAFNMQSHHALYIISTMHVIIVNVLMLNVRLMLKYNSSRQYSCIWCDLHALLSPSCCITVNLH